MLVLGHHWLIASGFKLILNISVPKMISVERILEYTNLEPEEQDKSRRKMEKDHDDVPSSWPDNGKIEFNRLTFSYKPNSRPVLNSIHLQIKAAEKVGIVGMTGSGKTSLFMAILRMAPLSGQILIDDVDISTISLRTLRSRITNIPVRVKS